MGLMVLVQDVKQWA